jgi:ABC-2 type transport system ATP-binding protein
MDEAERCSRVGLMYQGEIIRQGAPAELRQLVRGDLIAIIADDLAATERVIAPMSGVSEVQAYGDRLHVFVDDATRRLPEIENALKVAGVRVVQIRTAVPHLQEVFISLVTTQDRNQKDEG